MIDEAMRSEAENPDGTLKPVVTFACVLYQGEDVPAHSLGIFTPEWVDRLYRGIKRHCTRPFRFVCYVDRDYTFAERVETRKLVMPYRNMFSLLEPFREDLGRVVFMGLDTIIVGNIDALADYAGPFAMLQDPYYPDRDCSGVMCFPHTPAVWEAFKAGHEKHAREQTMFGFPSDMIWLNTVPHERLAIPGIYSYKAHCREGMPADARIVYFHGKEKPHELDLPWVREHWGEPVIPPGWHSVKFIEGMNTPFDTMFAQMRTNLAREDVDMMIGRPAHVGEALIVGGGPSLADTLPKLQFHHKRGGLIFALNGTHDWLISRGIIPDFHVMLDARPDNMHFVAHPHRGVTYLMASQCHPDVFDALKGYEVVQWVGWAPGVEEVVKEFDHRPIGIVGGGNTVGLKTMCMVHMLGFRTQRLFGFDSSYRNGENHAYKQPLNDNEAIMPVMCAGREFVCARWMAKQAEVFAEYLPLLMSMGAKITVYGDGLIPWIAKNMEHSDVRSNVG